MAGWFVEEPAATPFVLVEVGPRSAVEGNPALWAALAVVVVVACTRFGPVVSTLAGWVGQVGMTAAGPKSMVGIELVD